LICVAIDTFTNATQLSPTIGNATDPVEQRTANHREAGQSRFCFTFDFHMSYKQACFFP